MGRRDAKFKGEDTYIYSCDYCGEHIGEHGQLVIDHEGNLDLIFLSIQDAPFWFCSRRCLKAWVKELPNREF